MKAKKTVIIACICLLAVGVGAYFAMKHYNLLSSNNFSSVSSKISLENRTIAIGNKTMQIALPTKMYDFSDAKAYENTNTNDAGKSCKSLYYEDQQRTFSIIMTPEGCAETGRHGPSLFTDIDTPKADKSSVKKVTLGQNTGYAFTEEYKICTNHCENVQSTIGLLRLDASSDEYKSVQIVSEANAGPAIDTNSMQAIVQSIQVK